MYIKLLLSIGGGGLGGGTGGGLFGTKPGGLFGGGATQGTGRLSLIVRGLPLDVTCVCSLYKVDCLVSKPLLLKLVACLVLETLETLGEVSSKPLRVC